ncbi:MAG: porin [Flavobacteriaceae bacterium]|nr:porin [Flavobacteriaceae bacterium]
MKNKLMLLLAFIFIIQSNQLFAQGCDEGDDKAKEEKTEAKAGDSKIKVFGFLQAQYDYSVFDDANTFKFKRARVGVTGAVAKDFTYYVVLETAPLLSANGSVYLLDAFITYHKNDWAKFSLGQFKQPFGLEVNTACNGLTTIERSMISDQLVAPQRDLGLMWLGGNKDTKLRYAIALQNGSGISTVDNNKKKDVSGRVSYKAFDFLTVGGSFRYGFPTNNDDDRTTFGADAEAKYKNFKVVGEYIYDEGAYNAASSGGCGGAPATLGPRRQGAYVTASYMTKWNIEPVYKYEYFDTSLDYSMNMNEIVTLGVNYYINNATRLQLNYQYKVESYEIDNDAILVQLQVKF